MRRGSSTLLHLLKLRLRLGGRLARYPLLGGHGAGDRLDQLLLHMEYIRRVVCAEVLFNISPQGRCLVRTCLVRTIFRHLFQAVWAVRISQSSPIESGFQHLIRNSPQDTRIRSSKWPVP
jgi:hypothetical protein